MKTQSKMNRTLGFIRSAVLSSSILLYSSAALAQQPAYQQGIDWAANDSGHPNCVERYLLPPGTPLTLCFFNGNRSCVTDIAIEAAYRHEDQLALYLMAEITQCHNSDARDVLYSAGPEAVGNYMRTVYNRPAWGPALELAVLIAQALQ